MSLIWQILSPMIKIKTLSADVGIPSPSILGRYCLLFERYWLYNFGKHLEENSTYCLAESPSPHCAKTIQPGSSSSSSFFRIPSSSARRGSTTTTGKHPPFILSHPSSRQRIRPLTPSVRRRRSRPTQIQGEREAERKRERERERRRRLLKEEGRFPRTLTRRLTTIEPKPNRRAGGARLW